MAGPALVEAGMGERVDKEALGGADIVARAGTVDPRGRVGGGCVRRGAAAARLPPAARLGAATSGGADRRRPRPAGSGAARPGGAGPAAAYDVRALLAAVFDRGSVQELGRGTPRRRSPRWPGWTAGRWRSRGPTRGCTAVG